jgi:hypothetical protein
MVYLVGKNFNNFMFRFFSVLLCNYFDIHEDDAVSAKESFGPSPVSVIGRIGL